MASICFLRERAPKKWFDRRPVRSLIPKVSDDQRPEKYKFDEKWKFLDKDKRQFGKLDFCMEHRGQGLEDGGTWMLIDQGEL